MTLGALACTPHAAACNATAGAALASDPRMQAAIERAASAKTDEEFAAEVRALAALGGPNFRDLVPQLVVFALQQRDTRAAMTPAVIRTRLGITDAQLVEALLPYLDTPDPQQRAQLRNWLRAVDTATGDRRDFRIYQTIVAARRDDPPLGLVRYMYDTDADAALAALAEIYAEPGRRGALLDARRPLAAYRAGRRDESGVAAARAALHTLSGDPAWWQRLYAAAALAQMPELRTPELIEPLRRDAHPLVRDMAAGRCLSNRQAHQGSLHV